MRFLQIGSQNWMDTIEIQQEEDQNQWFFVHDTITNLQEFEMVTLEMRQIQDNDKINKNPKVEIRPTHLSVEKFIGEINAILIENPNGMAVLSLLKNWIQPYTVFYNREIPETRLPNWSKLYGFFPIDMSNHTECYHLLKNALFNGQYGDKMSVAEFTIQPTLKQVVTRHSLSHLTIEGDFGLEQFRPIGSWRINRQNFTGLNLEIWFEHECSEEVELQLCVRQIQEGSIEQVISEVVYSHEEIQKAIVLEETNNGQVAISLKARGCGKIDIGVLHVRWSRMGFGKFLLGGDIVSDASKDEINYFFHPGDMKPPLCVYFSGFRSAEGFEGYFMMKNMKTPFLLISDQRLLGGAFYMGSLELEQKVREVIQNKLDLLGFTNRELIFSGLSMGTYGSLYYASDFNPHAVIIGKPLANLGKMAVLNKTFSPGSFATSLYVLRKFTEGLSSNHVQKLQNRFWEKFSSGNYENTTFGIVYMKEDDYDPTAYFDILSHLHHSHTKIIGKGLSGRHSDAADAAVHWILIYYKHILERDFGRK